VDSYRTEEDQIRAIKQWWERNGSSTLIGVGLAMAIVFGTQWTQQQGEQGAEQAAVIYQQLLQAAEGSMGDPVKQATAEHLATQLKELRAGKRHGDYASMMLARLKADKGEFAAAETELRALLERQPDVEPGVMRAWIKDLIGQPLDPRIGALARVRLARVLVAMGRSDDALALLDAAGNGDFAVERLELRGDILRVRGDRDGALGSYEEALKLAAEGGSTGTLRILELKAEEIELSTINTADTDAASPSREPAPPSAQAEEAGQ
jgi:predicted negative regulator of RcsB-dependent stress response